MCGNEATVDFNENNFLVFVRPKLTNMKNLLSLSLILLIINSFSISGQEAAKKPLNVWSISLSFAPIETFYYYPRSLDIYSKFSPTGIDEDLYPRGVNFAVNRTLTKRFSVSTGLNYKFHHTKNDIVIIGEWGGGSYSEKSVDDMHIFDVPIELNYQLLKSPGFLDPFLKTGLRNTYFKRSYVGHYSSSSFEGNASGEIADFKGTFMIFYELGFGTYLNIFKSVSIMVETNLTSTLSGLGFIELQGGLKYSF